MDVMERFWIIILPSERVDGLSRWGKSRSEARSRWMFWFRALFLRLGEDALACSEILCNDKMSQLRVHDGHFQVEAKQHSPKLATLNNPNVLAVSSV